MTRIYHHHHRHKHPGLDHLARSVSRVKIAHSIVSLVSQLFSFRVGCKGIILKGFGFVAFIMDSFLNTLFVEMLTLPVGCHAAQSTPYYRVLCLHVIMS
jgi:hypothetical protein